MWDQATGQQVMSNFLASLPNIDGVWTQDGMASGVLAGDHDRQPGEVAHQQRRGAPELPGHVERPPGRAARTSRPSASYNPPGVGASGLRVVLNMLQGKEVDESKLAGPCGNTLYVPIPGVVTGENFAAEWEAVKDLPASWTLDGIISQEEADGFFKVSKHDRPRMGRIRRIYTDVMPMCSIRGDPL